MVSWWLLMIFPLVNCHITMILWEITSCLCENSRKFYGHFKSKGCLQIPVPSQWYVPISIVLCEMDIHRASLVVRRASRTARILTLEVLVETWTVPAGFPHVDVPFSTASDFQKFESHLNFHFLFLLFLPTPEMDTYPAEEHLTPNIVNTTKTAYVPVSMVCTHLKNSRFFSVFFFKRKMVASILKVRRIELIRKAEPTR